MKDKEITLYDSYYSLEKEEQIRRMLFEEYGKKENWESPDEIPQQCVFDEMAFQNNENWNCVKEKLKELFNKDYYLLTGYCGTWRGNLDGGYFIFSIEDLLRNISHLEDFRITDNNGRLIIEGSHHDGNDWYEIKRLTNKGYELASSRYFMRDRKLHDTIMRCNLYSALPKFARRFYSL